MTSRLLLLNKRILIFAFSRLNFHILKSSLFEICFNETVFGMITLCQNYCTKNPYLKKKFLKTLKAVQIQNVSCTNNYFQI